MLIHQILRYVIAVISFVYLSCSKSPAEQCDHQSQSNDCVANSVSSPHSVGYAKDADTHKENADEKLISWFSDLMDFRLTDFFLVIFTWILATKTSGLYVETAAMRAIVAEQRQDMLRSIKAAEDSAKAALISAEHFSKVERAYLFLALGIRKKFTHSPTGGKIRELISHGKTKVKLRQ